MNSRTAAQHREAVESWRATAPKHDHQIFVRKSTTEKPRHRDLSELSALLALRSRPAGVAEGEGVIVEPPAPIQTNWRLTPANDNEVPHDEAGVERAVEYVPSLPQLRESFAELEMTYRAEPMMLDGGRQQAKRAGREVHAIPVSGDFEYGVFVDEDGKKHKTIVRIGKLDFSDGTRTERGLKLVEGKLVDHNFRLPVGALLNSREKSTRDKGSEVDNTGSNSHYRWMVKEKARAATPPKIRPKKQERIVISKEDARQMLADAIANTPVMPAVKYCTTGFPAGPTNLRQLFLGGRKGKKGESGSQAWQDIYTEKENRETFQRGLDIMQDKHVHLLTETMSAKSLSEIGEKRGYRGRHAVDAGRRLLVTANDNFILAMELAEYAAEDERRENSRKS